MKRIVLKKEDLSHCVEVDLAEIRSKRNELINLCCRLNFERISANKKIALKSNLIEVERLKKELSMLQECNNLLKKEKELIFSSAFIEKVSSLQASASSSIQAFKESFEGRAFTVFGGLSYTNLTIKLVKELLPRQGKVVPERPVEFENMDFATMDTEDSTGAIHNGSTFANMTGASPPSGD
ncbi:hypothetical protein SLEP1_g24568 [Rubroshorea leprosula]|uniref:Uncharacterized protein n=1 Tax=Rubroshorea leprosula TaxID=152421 RepID=A0AAV5JMA9_9ROSI|nr:hypothetical protein SLEP1_g24568 [Rubroshorea leprosula]